MPRFGAHFLLPCVAALLTGCSLTNSAPTSSVPPAATLATSAASPVAASPSVGTVPSPIAPAAPSAAPSPSPAGSNLTGTIKFVSSLPRTGLSRDDTDSINNAVQMAINDVQGHVGNATLVYQQMDDASPTTGQWDATAEANNARAALADPDVFVYIGPFNSNAAKVSIPLLCQGNLAMISPSASYVGLTRQVGGMTTPDEPDVYYRGCQRNFLRDVPADDVQAKDDVAWARSLGATKVFLLDDGMLYGNGMALSFQTEAARVGLEIAGDPVTIDVHASSYTDVAAQVKASGADLVYFGGIAQDNPGQLWRDLRAAVSSDVRLMAPDGLYDPAFVESAGSVANGTFISLGLVPPDKLPGGQDFQNRYTSAYHNSPLIYAAYAYDAARAAISAIQQANARDRGRIRDALFALRNQNGVLGSWSFTASGDTTLDTATGRRVANGDFDDSTLVVLQPIGSTPQSQPSVTASTVASPAPPAAR